MSTVLPKIIPVFSHKNIGIDEKNNLCLHKDSTFADVSEFFEIYYPQYLRENEPYFEAVRNRIRNDKSLDSCAVAGIIRQTDEEMKNYLFAYYLMGMADALGPEGEEVTMDFMNLFETKSIKTVYDFFIDHKIFDPHYEKGAEDLEVFYHTKFY